MIILIAESKTMSKAQRPVDSLPYGYREPAFYPVALQVADELRRLSVTALADRLGIGPKAAAGAFDDYYGFADHTTGLTAIEAFTGVVFKNLDYNSLTDSGQEYVNGCVRLISSLYGYLRPDDTVKPYRLEFNSKVMPGGSTPRTYWRADVTGRLIADIKEGGHREVINLLPKDAADCIDWAEVRKVATVTVAEFKVQRADKMVTPHAGLLKTLRGKLLRSMALHGVKSVADLPSMPSDDFQLDEELSTASSLLFVTA